MVNWLKNFPEGVFKKSGGKYVLTFGAGNSLEPFYYRILYSLNTLGIKKVKKVYDYYNISPRSQEFGFASQNLRQEMTSASQLLGQIGQVVKSITAMRKDQQRIEECVKYYDEKHVTDDITLKGIWADMVDPKSGASSFINVAKNLDLYVARDWFFKIKDSKELMSIPKGKIPDVVKNYLARKFKEYEVWKPQWKKSLMHFKKILDQQYEASKKTIELYRDWVQPLLYNVESLKMKGDYSLSPEMLKVSSSLLSEVKLVAWRPGDYEEPKDLKQAKASYIKRKVEKDKGGVVSTYIPFGKAYTKNDKGQKVEVPFIAVIEVKLKLIGPSNTQYMTTIAEVEGKIYTIEEFENKLFDVWTKDPAEEWIKNLMLREGLNLDEEEVKKDVKKKVERIPGQEFIENIFKTLKVNRRGKAGISKKMTDHMVLYYANKTLKTLEKGSFLVYYILKKSFGMYTYDLER